MLLNFHLNPSFFVAIFTAFCRNCGKSQIIVTFFVFCRIIEKCLRSFEKTCKVLLKIGVLAGCLQNTSLPVESSTNYHTAQEPDDEAILGEEPMNPFLMFKFDEDRVTPMGYAIYDADGVPTFVERFDAGNAGIFERK